MKILFVPYGTEKAPATRYRVFQYLPHLKNKDIGYEVFSAISGLSTELMLKSPNFNRIAKLFYYGYIYLERIIRAFYIISVAARFDVILMQRTSFPLRLEKILKMFNSRIIFDIDDAVYLPDKEENGIIFHLKKYMKEREVINMVKIARAAIVENEYIKSFVSHYCKDVLKIPGPIDTDRFFVKEKKADLKEVVIGWIGSPATTDYLFSLEGVLKAIKEKYSFVKYCFIGLGSKFDIDIEYERIDWRYDTEVQALQNFDIGIMSMPNDRWTKGKLGCKMLQYMAVGVPSVVSYTETNAEIIEDGANGFFARTVEEWISVLSKLIENRNLRRAVGLKGRDTVVRKCGLANNIERYISIFEKVAV